MKLAQWQRLTNGFTVFVVVCLSLLLLLYLGYGEGVRTYGQFHIDKLTSEGKVVQNIMEGYLRADLPLKDYAGFTKLAEPIVAGQDIDALIVYDQNGRKLDEAIDTRGSGGTLEMPEAPAAVQNPKDSVVVVQDARHFQVVIPLHNRFEVAGSLVVVSSVAVVTRRLHAAFDRLAYVAVGLSLAFAVLMSWLGPKLVNSRLPWMQINYGVTFLIMAAFVVGTLVALYSQGVQGKAADAASMLGLRLDDVVKFNLRIRDFEGLDKTLEDYLRADPELSEAAVIVDDKIFVDTDTAKIGQKWVSRSDQYDFTASPEVPTDHVARIQVAVAAVALPVALVYQKVEQSIRNFLALFIASGFVASLFLQVANSMQRSTGDAAAADPILLRARRVDAALNVVKPIYFLAVFLENMTYSFLPKFMQDSAVASGMSVSFASAPFTAFYLTFALSLIPAGHFAQQFGARRVIWGGLLLSGAAVLGLALPVNIFVMIVLRALSGIGQGFLIMGVQSYILDIVPPEKKTQGQAIIVVGFQGGMISGMAIGSLLVTQLGTSGIFMISGFIGLAAAAYTLVFIPATKAVAKGGGLSAAISKLGNDIRRVVWNSEFLKTILFIGMPTKAILTGVITFALPLLLVQQGYAREEVGQLIMLYGIGVLVSSSYVSRLVDRKRNSGGVLFFGALAGGIGLIMIGLMSTPFHITGIPFVGSATMVTAMVILGIIVVGLAHGCINAPVMTHVADSSLARQIGANPVTAVYRFLERIGHIAGPFLLSQFFLIWGQTPLVLAGIGTATGIFAFLFILRIFRPQVEAIQGEPAQ